MASDAAGPSREAKVMEVSTSAIERLDQPILASSNGGPIAVNKDGEVLEPTKAYYRVRLIAEKGAIGDEGHQVQIVPGAVQIDTDGRSFAGWLSGEMARAFRRIF